MLPETHQHLRTLAIEKYGSVRAVGRVLDEVVEEKLLGLMGHQDTMERLEETRRQVRTMEVVAADLAKEKEEYRRQLERIRAMSPGLVRQTRRKSRVEAGGQVVVQEEWIEKAEQTPCRGGCGFFMDPKGLEMGLELCPSCRAN